MEELLHIPDNAIVSAAAILTSFHMRGAGVWQVENVLDAADAPAYTGEFEPHTLSIEVEDRPGVLNQARPANDVQHLSGESPSLTSLVHFPSSAQR